MKPSFVLAWLLFLLCLPAHGQIPNSLQHSIASPLAIPQRGGEFGTSVAVNSTFTVVGVPKDDIGGDDAGIVKVFDTTTGALLFLLTNPEPEASDRFGFSVSLDGTQLVVGSPGIDGGAYVYDIGGATPTVPVHFLDNPSVTGDNFGISVAISGSRVVVGANLNGTGAANSGAAFVYDLSGGTPALPVHTLINPTPLANDQFGISVAIAGNFAVVGASLDDTGAVDAGSAYVYDLTSGTPTTPLHTLNNPGPLLDDRFGNSVSITGSRVVVGALSDDTGGSNAGSVYVYDLISGTPTLPVHTLNNPLPTPAGDQMGVAVSISGNRVIVGLNQEDTGASNTGSALVYDLAGGTPTVPVLTLNNPAAAANDSFGKAVALNGSLAVVGAPLDDAGATDAGSAYVYNIDGGTPTVPVRTLNSPGIGVNDRFGAAVDVEGTIVVVGANRTDSATQDDEGTVHVFDLASATPLVPVLTLTNPGPSAGGSQFGSSVAISSTRIVVGAPFDDAAGIQTGSAFVFDMSSGTPSVPVFVLPNPAPAALDSFGCSVDISGTRVVVGARSDNAGANDAGSAYVYDLTSGTPTTPVFTLPNPTPASNDNFGNTVAISGTRVVVGADTDDTSLPDAGIAYVYDLTSGSPTVPALTLNNPTPLNFERFGRSVAIDGTRIVVGSSSDGTVGSPGLGGAYVYDLLSGTPATPIVSISNPAPLVGDEFGFSVSISGTLVVVGAFADDAGAVDSGTAYVYSLTSGTPSLAVATLDNPAPAIGDNFGASVAISGTTVVIGAPFDDTALTNKGSAYVFIPGAPPVPAPVTGTLGDVVTGALAPDAGGASDGTQFDALQRSGYLAENGTLAFLGYLKTGVGGVDATNFMAYWKHDGSTLTRIARQGFDAPETGATAAKFNILPLIPGINDGGQVTLFASLLQSGASTPPTTAANDLGIWSELGGTGFQILIREDDTIPGLGGPKVDTLGYGCFATAKTSATTGEAAFVVGMKGSSTDTALLRCSVVNSITTAVGVIARENVAAPGGGGETFGSMETTRARSVRMDATGNVVFAGWLKTSGKFGIWYQDQATKTVSKTVLAGETAPGTTATFQTIDLPNMGGGGTYAFRAVLNPDGDNNTNLKNDGIWKGTATAAPTLILRRGDTNTNRPGLFSATYTGPNPNIKAGNIFTGWLTNANHGAWLGWVDLAGDGISNFPADTFGIYTDTSGTMTLLTASGQPVPGIPGASFFFIDHPVCGGTEQVAFIATVTGGGVTTGTNDKGVWRTASNGGALSLVLRTGDTITTTQGTKTIADVDIPGSNYDEHIWETPVMDSTGRLLIFVTFIDGSTSQVLVP